MVSRNLNFILDFLVLPQQPAGNADHENFLIVRSLKNKEGVQKVDLSNKYF